MTTNHARSWAATTATTIAFAALTSALFGGCGLVRTLAGADIDLEQLAKAREAAVLQQRWMASARLAQRLAKHDDIEDADIVCYLSEDAVNRAAAQLVSTRGWIDPDTRYVIRGVTVRLYNGSAMATLSLEAHNTRYDVRVNLAMDCLLSLGFEKVELVAELTPFQVSPDVSTGALLSSASDIIRDMIEIKLSNLGKEFPPIRFPVDFAKSMPVEGGAFAVRDKLNMDVRTPNRVLLYTLSVKEILIFERKAMISFNIPKVQVK